MIGAVLAATAVVVAPASGPAEAVTGAYAAWTVAGANPSWAGTMTVAALGFPAATFATNSNSPSIASSATLGAGTPFGAQFGTSSGQQYLSFRAAASQRPSTTTFTFESPTPASGWGFALGDIDAEAITLEATGPDGPLTAAELGYRSSFNYAGAGDEPVWNPATATLSGNGNDTNGASGWFMPTAPITSLTVTFTTLTGFPIAQMWVAANTSTISGTVDDVTGTPAPSGGHTIDIYDENDQRLASVVTAADGTYTSPALVSAIYTVKIVPAVGFAVVGPAARLAVASAGNATGIDFDVAVPPAPTTTTITSPSEATVGSPATITGYVTVSTSATPPIIVSGAVTVSGLGSGCIDSALASVSAEPYQLEFSCEITPTEPGAFLITASYQDTATPVAYGSSADSSVIDVDGAVIASTTTITSIAPDPAVVGAAYTVAGTVGVAADAPAGELPGSVTITGDGSGCLDTDLAASTVVGLYVFSCSIVPTAVGTVTLTAAYADPSDHFGPSSDTALQRVVAAPPPGPSPTPPTPPSPVTVDRVAGTDRVATAVVVARRYFPTGAPIVYVATERDFADALVAGPPAGLDDAPVLLTAPDDLPATVAAEIRRLGPAEIVIVGGTNAVSARVEGQLAALAPTITRIGGIDRYATAALLARQRIGGSGGEVYIASGTTFADAVSAGVPAARAGAPILLVTAEAVPAVTATEVQRRRPTEAIVVGGSTVIGPAVVNALAGVVGRVERVAGGDRYATSAAITRQGVGSIGSGATVFLVTGADFPDALAAVPAAVVGGGAVLLTRPACLPPSVAAELRRLDPTRVTLIGGVAALSSGVLSLTECP